MNSEENDDLWRLLGQARRTEASPFFARNVVRTIREDQAVGATSWWHRLGARWRPVAAGAAVVALAAFIALDWGPRPDPVFVLASQVSASPDLHVISHLDELLDSEQNSVWLEASSY